MSNALWPTLHGLSWTLKRTPRFKNQAQPGSQVGVETRVGYGADPVYDFELSYEVLYAGSKGTSLSQLEAFFEARRGTFDSFLIDPGAITKNPAESFINGQQLTIDANGNAPLIRTKPGSTYNEAIYELAVDGAGNYKPPALWHAGRLLTLNTDYQIEYWPTVATGALNANNISYSGIVIKMISSPPITNDLTANFGWTYRVRFDEDSLELEMFHYLLWKCQTVKLTGTRF
jgi:hypothetical protein